MPKALFTKDDYFKLLRNIIKPSFSPGELDGGGGEPPVDESILEEVGPFPQEPAKRTGLSPDLLKAVRIAQGARDHPSLGEGQPVRPPTTKPVSPLTFTQAIEDIITRPLQSFLDEGLTGKPKEEPIPPPTPITKTPGLVEILKDLGKRAEQALMAAERTGSAAGATWEVLKAGMAEIAPAFEPFAVAGKVGATNLFNLVRSLQSLAPGGARPQMYRAEGGPPMSAEEAEAQLKATGVTPWLTVPVSEAITWLSIPGGVYLPYDAAQLAQLGARLATKGFKLVAKGAGKYGAEAVTALERLPGAATTELGLAKGVGKGGKKVAPTPAAPVAEAVAPGVAKVAPAEVPTTRPPVTPEIIVSKGKFYHPLDIWAIKKGSRNEAVAFAKEHNLPYAFQWKGVGSFVSEQEPRGKGIMLLAKPKVAEAVAPGVAKEPWQMTNEEFYKNKTSFPKVPSHRYAVRQALSEGKPVPPEVLKDYPDLAKGVAKAPAEAIKPVVSPEIAIPSNLVDDAERLGVSLDDVRATWAKIQSEYTIPKGATANLKEGPKGAGISLSYPMGDFIAHPEKYAKIPKDIIPLVKTEAPFPAEAIKPTVEAPGAIPKAEVVPGGVPPVKPPIEPPIIGKVAPMPPGGSASKRVLDRIQMEQPEPGFITKVRQGYHQFQVSMIDDLYALKKFTGQATKGGAKLAIEENPYILARLLRGVSGKINTFIENGTFGKKFWKIEKGKAVPNFTGESLENILKEIREPEAWQDFSAYLVARRSKELVGRNIKTGLTLEDAIGAMMELETKYKNFPQLADRVYKYQDSLLVYGKEMGLLSEELLGNLRQYGNYVPFYRVFNELSAKGFMGKKMANIASPIKRITGSEREIINPLESIVKNTHVLINAADRNQVGIMMANLVDKNPELAALFERVKTPMARVAGVTAKDLGVEIAGLSDEAAEAVVDIFRPSFFTRGDEVTVLIDGKKAYFKVDPDLRDALLNLDRESLGMIGKFLSLPAKWLRAGATLSPDFMVRNPARDAMTAMVYSNYNFLPGVDFVRGLASIIKQDANYKLFRLSGAEHSMMVSMDREYLHKTFTEIVQGKKFTDYVKHPLELFQIVSELGEKATRLGEFKAGIRRGAIPLQAGYAARNITLDFAQAGTTARAVNNLIAFFNANVRGWAKMISDFKEHPVRTSAKVFAGITMPSVLLYIANRDDPRWKEILRWQKDLFWIVMTKETIYRIPKPFELGIIFGSIPERFLEWLDNKDPALFKETLKNLVEAGSPGFLPTAALPIIENLSNYSFFRGGPIVPASREKMPPELQYTRWTSEVSKHLGELLKQPPAKIDNLINGWTGGLGRYATDILDGILKKTGISPDIPEPSPTLVDRPVIKAFVVRNPYGSSGEAVEGFYDALKKYEQGEKYLKEMLELGDKGRFEQYKAAHPELLFFMDFEKDTFYSASARYLRRVARDLTELRKKQDGIYKATDITPDEKRRLIDEIDVLKTEVSRKALGLLTGEGQVLQESIKDAIKKLGTIIEETPVLSLEKPDIFDTQKLYTEFGNLLEAATKEDLSKLKGIDPLASAFVGARDIKKETGSILNKQVSDIKLDLKEGVSFEEYYKAWQSGAEKNEEFDKLTRRQLDLLASYNKLDKAGKAQFLKDHPELKSNPYQEWLKAHPKENTQLAIWGQAKLLTQEADTEARRLIKELDIPDSALPDLTLPPELSVKGYVQYLEQGKEFGYNSAEVKLLLAKDDKLREFLEREPVDTPVASLELKVKHRKLFDLRDAYSDKDSPDYLDDKVKDAQGLTARDRVQAKLKADNPEWVDDMRRIEAIEHEADDKTVEAWVEHGKLAGEEPGYNAEEKLWLLDNPEVHKWALDNKLLTDDGSKWNEPVLRLDVQWRKEDAEYDALPEEGNARKDYLAANEAYRQDRRRREAYQKGLIDRVEDYVAYYELPVAGYRQERFLAENPDFANAVGLRVPTRVPAVQYDELTEKYQSQFDRLEELGDNKSEFYIEDPGTREVARKAMRFDVNGRFTEFGLAEMRRKAYGLLVPQGYIQNYVDYYKLIGEGKPENYEEQTGTSRWYEDDWWMMEHPGFYKEVYLGILGNDRKDYRKVPTREVFALYQQYLALPKGSARTAFRKQHPDLDAWGKLALGWGSSEPSPSTTTSKPTPKPRGRSAWDLLEEQGLLGALKQPPRYYEGETETPEGFEGRKDEWASFMTTVYSRTKFTGKGDIKSQIEAVRRHGQEKHADLEGINKALIWQAAKKLIGRKGLNFLGLDFNAEPDNLTLANIDLLLEYPRIERLGVMAEWGTKEILEAAGISPNEDPLDIDSKRWGLFMRAIQKFGDDGQWEAITKGTWDNIKKVFGEKWLRDLGYDPNIDPTTLSVDEIHKLRERFLKAEMELHGLFTITTQGDAKALRDKWLAKWDVPKSEWQNWQRHVFELQNNPAWRGAYLGKLQEGPTGLVGNIGLHLGTPTRAELMAHEFAHANYFEEMPSEMRKFYPYMHILAQELYPFYVVAISGYPNKQGFLPVEGYAEAYTKLAPQKLPWFLEPFYGNLLFAVPDKPDNIAKSAMAWLVAWMEWQLDLVREEASPFTTPFEAFMEIAAQLSSQPLLAKWAGVK